MDAKINIISDACKVDNFIDCYLNNHSFCGGIRDEINSILDSKIKLNIEPLEKLINNYICGILSFSLNEKLVNHFCANVPENINFITKITKKYGNLLNEDSLFFCANCYCYFRGNCGGKLKQFTDSLDDRNFVMRSNIDINKLLSVIPRDKFKHTELICIIIKDYLTTSEIENKQSIHTEFLNFIVSIDNFKLAKFMLNNKSISDNNTIYICMEILFKKTLILKNNKILSVYDDDKEKYNEILIFLQSLCITKHNGQYLLYYSCFLVNLQLIEHFLVMGFAPDKTSFRIIISSTFCEIKNKLLAIKLLINNGYKIKISDLYAAIKEGINIFDLVGKIKPTTKMLNYACFYGANIQYIKKLIKYGAPITQHCLYFVLSGHKYDKKIINFLLSSGLIIDDECIFLMANLYDPEHAKMHKLIAEKIPTCKLPHINTYFSIVSEYYTRAKNDYNHNQNKIKVLTNLPKMIFYDNFDLPSDDDIPAY